MDAKAHNKFGDFITCTGGKFIIPSATRGKQFKGTSRRFDGFRFYINQAVIKTIYKVVKMFFSIEATLKYKNV